jgi:hypothetical protein
MLLSALATITGDFTIGDVIFQPSNFNPAMLNNPSMFSLLISGNSLILHFTPVPEPAFIVTICLGAAAGWRVVRKRLLWM